MDDCLGTDDRRAAADAASPRLGGRPVGTESAASRVGTFRLGPDRTILAADAAFAALFGILHEEVIGVSFDRFVHPTDLGSDAYGRLWSRLAAGEAAAYQVRALRRDGREVGLHVTFARASLDDAAGDIVGHAADVSAAWQARAEARSRIDAIDERQCVVTFDLNGTVLDANANFLAATGYNLDQVLGRHHRMFVDAREALGLDYAAFWRELARGRVQAGSYRRLGRGGREVWFQGAYTPLRGADRRPTKVVAHAVPVTDDRLFLARYQSQIEAIHKTQCVIAFDLGGVVLDANDRFLDVMGYRYGEVCGRHHRMFCGRDEYASDEYAAFWSRLARGEPQAGEYKRIARGGREVWFQAAYNPILDLNGRPFQVVKYATDITAHKLRLADFEGQIAATNKSQGVVSMELDGTIREMNGLFLDMLGYTLDEVRGRHHSMLVEPEEAASPAYARFWETLRAGTFVAGMHKRIGRDGRTLWIRATYNPILDLNGRPYKIVKHATDVTSEVAIAEAFEDAKRQALCDPTTLLPNRARLLGYLNGLLAEPDRRVTVLYADLDGFKRINASFGESVGDKVLGEIADRLRRSLTADQMAARLGGDEFVIAAADLTDADVEALCGSLLDAVAEPIRHEGQEIGIGVSIGVASAPTDAATSDELIRCADRALQRSKKEGQHTFSYFSPDTNERVTARRRKRDEISRGMERGEFFLEYQPRFDLERRNIRSVEALVRWNHPERGRTGPGDFIPSAEQTGLIVPLGEWIMNTACRAAAGWDGIGVSVNVSPVQFRDGRLVAAIAGALVGSGLAPERLEVEITEGVLLEDADRARELLLELKAMGVRLAMDDFGTGYSSLGYLRRFPFDVIKIDRRFVADIDDEGGQAVVAAILGLGRALGLSVTAEGVETEEQLAMLTEARCAEAQGFLLARPMPEDHVTTLLREGGSGFPSTVPAHMPLLRPRGPHGRRGEDPRAPPVPLSA